MYKEILTKMYIEAYKRLKLLESEPAYIACAFRIKVFGECPMPCWYHNWCDRYSDILRRIAEINSYMTVRYYTGHKSDQISHYYLEL